MPVIKKTAATSGAATPGMGAIAETVSGVSLSSILFWAANRWGS
jgi:hypothetical protein